MQIYALDAQGIFTHTLRAGRGEVYRCPECQAQVRLRGGRLKKLHFYHLEASSCRLHGKSMTHLHIQYALQKTLFPEKTLLEHRFPRIGRIADVVWPAQKLIFEVQVSPISAEEVRARNRDYKQMGYQVIWILHDRQFNRTQMTAAEAHLRSSPHYFTDINGFGKGIFYDQYSAIHFKRRVKRSSRFNVRFSRIAPVNIKQLPRHFPPERRKWNLSFEGDLFHRQLEWQIPPKKPPLLHRIFSLYRIFLHLLLEKTTW